MWRYSLALLIPLIAAQQFTPENYPNPRKGGYKECNMRSASNVCDPDQILTESERYRLNNELVNLNSKTGTSGNTFCDRKGIDGVLVIVPQGSQDFADQLNKRWALDGQCEKSAVFLLSSNDRKLYLGEDGKTGLTNGEFQAMAAAEDTPMQSGQFTTALMSIFKEIAKRTSPFSETAPRTTTPHQSGSPLSTLLATFIVFVAFLM